MNFVVEELAEFINTDLRTSRWLPTAKQQVDRPPEFSRTRTLTLDCVTPKCMAFTTTKFTVVAALSIPRSLGGVSISRRTRIDLTGSSLSGGDVA